MSTSEDKNLARVILKKGWVPKEILEDALREVTGLRKTDDGMTLARYLALKELLASDQIQWALDIVRTREGAATPGGTFDTPASHHLPALDREVPPRRRDVASRISAATVLFGAVAVAVIGALLYLTVLRPHGTTDPSVTIGNDTSGGAAARHDELSGERGTAAPSRIPPSSSGSQSMAPSAPAEGAAGSESTKRLREIESLADLYRRDKDYRGLIARYQKVIDESPRTPAAEKAALAIAAVKDAWNQAAVTAMETLTEHAREERFNVAMRMAIDLRRWCPELMVPRLVRKIQSLERELKKIEVSMLPPEEQPGVTGAGIGEKPSAGAPQKPEAVEPEKIGAGKLDPAELDPAEQLDPAELDPAELDPNTPEPEPVNAPAKKSASSFQPDKGSLLPGEDAMPLFKGEDNVILKLIEKHGEKELEKRLSLLFRGARIAISRTGRVRIGYDFASRESHVALDWSPTPGNSQRDKIRWSFEYETRTTGSYYYYYDGIRISEAGVFTSSPCFTDQILVEVCCCNSVPPKGSTHLLVGVYDKKQHMWYGTDYGAQAVKASKNGTIQDASPRKRKDLPAVGRVHWVSMTYQDDSIQSSLGYEAARSRTSTTSSGTDVVDHPVYWDVHPTYATTGALKVSKPLTEMKVGIAFYPNVVATIGYVRITGFVNPGWLREEIREKKIPLDL